MALFSRIRSTILLRHHNLRLFSASSILSPDSKTPLTSKEKSRAAIALLRSEKEPGRILDICRAASLTPEFHLDRIAFSVAIDNLTKSNNYSQVSELLEEFKKRPDLKTERFGAHSIVLYGQANMLDHAIRTFRELEESGIPRSVKSLNALLFSCILAKDYKEVKRIFVEFPKMYGINPDLETYNTVIKAFCESGGSSSAYSVIAEMSRKGVKPNASTFGVLLAGFYKEEKFEDVGKVLNMMKEHGVPISTSTHNIRIQSLCKLKKSSEAKALLDGMISNGAKPNAVSYRHLIHGFCKEGNNEEAKRLFKTMVNRGCKADSDCYFTLVYYLCQAGDFESALSICKESISKNWVPSFTIMKTLVNGLAGVSKIEEAKELVGTMKERFAKTAELWNEVEAGLPQ